MRKFVVLLVMLLFLTSCSTSVEPTISNEEVSKIAAAEPATAQATETAPVEATPVVEAAPVAEVAPAEPISVATKKEAAKPA